ncbi:hypothetical protein RSAG8_05789, partial [Rhizoctonia solani AG-8 WAC10335]
MMIQSSSQKGVFKHKLGLGDRASMFLRLYLMSMLLALNISSIQDLHGWESIFAPHQNPDLEQAVSLDI